MPYDPIPKGISEGLTGVKSLGNHEFDERVEGVVPFIRNVSTPILAANLILDDVPELQDERKLRKSVVIGVNGIKVGIIGYLTPDTKFLAPSNDVEYEDEVIAIRREVEKLQGEGVHILIALGHSGFIEDLKIAKDVEGLDVVVGGHSNTFLLNGKSSEQPEIVQGPYPTMVKQDSGRMVPVVQAYAHTKYMGRLHLIFDSDGEVIKCDGNPLLLDNSVPQDPEVLKLVEKYHAEMERVNNEVVGTSLETLTGNCRLRECNMGNLIVDAVLDYTKSEKVCSNIAIIQGGRIRASIRHEEHPMQLTKGDWYSVLPFSDALCVVVVNGSVLIEALEHSVDTWRLVDSTGQFLQISGMKVIYNLAKPPGERVSSAKAASTIDMGTCEETSIIEVKDDLLYRIVMPSFIAEGGDGYDVFKGLPTKILPYGELTPVFSYLSKNSPVNPLISDRLILLNEDTAENDIPTTMDPGIQKRLPSNAASATYTVQLIITALFRQIL